MHNVTIANNSQEHTGSVMWEEGTWKQPDTAVHKFNDICTDKGNTLSTETLQQCDTRTIKVQTEESSKIFSG